MTQPPRLVCRLLVVAALTASSVGTVPARRSDAYAPVLVRPLDTMRVRAELAAVRLRSSRLAVGAVVPGYLSARGLPPVPGRITVTDTGLVFRSATGSTTTLPLVGPVRETAGRRWRASTVALVYMDETDGQPIYVFRLDGGVFETGIPGPLLEVAAHPVWLDSVKAVEWRPDRPLVDAKDPVALWGKARAAAASPYADSLYALFGRPAAAVGLIGERGRHAGRLGEYIRSRDSLALDPGRMTGEAQLRHTLAHELGHRWQNRAPAQLAALWWGVPPIRDPKRYGYADVAEHQAEAIAFAVDFLQTTAGRKDVAGALSLLEHYELLVPGTRTMVRYLARRLIYRNHPLRLHLIS
ncbi:MAG TPA: hypothetical protein VFU40_04640 [Gemmatimonadales bacterium]|nr:hypothetical protein [Gemmatimonadales bacterium]